MLWVEFYSVRAICGDSTSFSSRFTGPLNAGMIIEAFFEFTHLKQLYRQGWLKRGVPVECCESVAEHSLGVAILALWFAQASFPELDVRKILIMALFHDFGEIYTGNLIPSDAVSVDAKHQREKQSVQQVLGKLPGGNYYLGVWEEFERGETPEAIFIRQIDRLEMGFQARVYGLQGLVDPAEFLQTTEQALTDPRLKQIFIELEQHV
jgi:putative hydrolase of HD superfamily